MRSAPTAEEIAKARAKWPLQKDMDGFYGNPRGQGGVVSKKWYAENIIYVKPPFKMQFVDTNITRIACHQRCANELLAALNEIWEESGKSQKTINQWGMNVFSGSHAYRPITGGRTLSTHAYGCGFDFDAPRNGYGDATPNFDNVPAVVNAFKRQGAEWGGDWKKDDGMHFQFARTK